MLPTRRFPTAPLVRGAAIAAVLILASCSTDGPSPLGPDGWDRVQVSPQASHLSGRTLYAVANDDAVLRTIDPATGATLSSVPITVPGATVRGANGLATDPSTDVLYAVLKVTGLGSRALATLDPGTGAASIVGELGDNFAGIAFSCTDLYGVTGDGAAARETFYRIDPATGTPTLLTPLGNGNDGETIGFNPDDGFMYHMSGLGTFNVDQYFETIDLNTLAVSPVSMSGDVYFEALALTYDSHGSFLMSGDWFDPRLLSISAGGVVSEIGPFGFTAKGLAFVPNLGCNQPPVADAGEDQNVEWTTASAGATMLDGSGSSDPDGDALSYSWSEGGSEIATGVNPTVNLSLGVHTITLTVDDGNGGTDTDEVEITVEDTTQPTVTAALDPVADKSLKSKKGFFTVAFSCTDDGDPDVSPTATLNEEPVEDGQVVELQVKSKKSEKSKKSTKSKKSEKPLKLSGPSFELVVVCVDAFGNEGTATAAPVFAEKSSKSKKP